jgi:capsular exopolysaccharide synthesis family protein
MELQNYLTILWRRRWVLVTVTALTVFVVAIGTFKMTPLYQASTTVRVATAPQGSLDNIRYDTTYADRLMKTYAKVLTSGPMLGELEQRLGLDKSSKIKVDTSVDTELMQITVEDPDPALAQKAANTLAELLIAHVRESDTSSGKSASQMIREQLAQIEDEIKQARGQYDSLIRQTPNDSGGIAAASRSLKLKEDTYATLFTQYERVRAMEGLQANVVSVVEPATMPEVPSTPRKELNIALGFLVGLGGGVLLASLLESLDTTLYTTEQIRRATDLPILGRIPIIKQKKNSYFFNGTSAAGEAFRHFRTSLLNLDRNAPLHKLLITSAEPGEGKSTVATNLAYSLTHAGLKVIIVDCDLRRPTLHKIFDLPNRQGLTNLLRRELSAREVVQYDRETGIWVLTSGPIPPNPAEMLGSDHMLNLVEQLLFDVVLFDAPSLLAVTDAAVLAPAVDGVVLVVSRAQARQGAVQAACELLETVKARSIGVVVNRAAQDGEYGFYHKRGATRVNDMRGTPRPM